MTSIKNTVKQANQKPDIDLTTKIADKALSVSEEIDITSNNNAAYQEKANITSFEKMSKKKAVQHSVNDAVSLIKKSTIEVLIQSIRLLPTKLISRAWGKIADLTRPKFMVKALINNFIKAYNIDMSLYPKPQHEYISLQDFFKRTIYSEQRPIAATTTVSPTDGKVAEHGVISGQTLIQAKGINYSLSALLGTDKYNDIFNEGYFSTVYLAPNDYHRIHAPQAGSVEAMDYIEGRLFPVFIKATETLDPLFTANERKVMVVKDNKGDIQYALVMVGAMLVGEIETSVHKGDTLTKGQDIGAFNMGSTIVLVQTKENAAKNKVTLKKGQVVKMGEAF